MGAPLTLRYEGDGEFKPVSAYWSRVADKEFVVGEQYRMAEIQERSEASHAHYFASVGEAWKNLPDELIEEYPTVEHLRKKALIRCGFCTHRDHVCASKAEAQRLRAFVKPMDDYAIVTVSEAVVRVYTAQSQSKKAMGPKVFQESKQAVLDWLDDLLGVNRGETEQNARTAA